MQKKKPNVNKIGQIRRLFQDVTSISQIILTPVRLRADRPGRNVVHALAQKLV